VPKRLLDVLAGKLGFVAREQTRQARIAEWAARVSELSLCQRQVMGLVAQGLSNKDIEFSWRREIAQLS
jgi:FixJ family two-component response regulator